MQAKTTEPLKKIGNGIEQLTYNHTLAIETGQYFIKNLVEEQVDSQIKGNFIQEWATQAKKKEGKGPIEFLAERTDIPSDKILAWGSRMSEVPIIDTDHVIAANSTYYIVDGLPMTLLSSSEFGAATIVHCLPFLEKKLDLKLLEDIYGALKINFALASPENLLKHIQKIQISGRGKNRILRRAEEDKKPDFKKAIHVLKSLELLPSDAEEELSKTEILEILEETKPRPNELGETEWWALKSKMPFVKLAVVSSKKELLEILSSVSQKERYVVPICQYGGILTLATKRNLKGTEKGEIIGLLKKRCKISSVLTKESTILDIINSNLSNIVSATNMAENIQLESAPEEEKGEVIDIEKIATDDKDPTIIKLVQGILIGAVDRKATDIHISPHPDQTWVRYRIDGNMVEADMKLDFKFWKAIISRIKIMSNIDIKFSPIAQDGKFPMTIGGNDYDIRVNTCPVIYGEKAIMRVQKKESTVPTLEGLGFYEHEKSLIQGVIESDHGLLIICGPTGSGKTTTLSATMYSIDRKRWNVITAENPVEIRIPDVEQTPIDGKLMTFGKFVPAALRQDPDYIMIGETRDKETTEEVIRAAITGHVVMTTLHTNSAAGAPGRLIDMGAQPFLITDAVKAVCAQRLIRRLCTNCARPSKKLPSQEELLKNKINPNWLRVLDEDSGLIEKVEYLLEPQGCKLCNNTGYKGRIAIIEGYFSSPEIRRIIIHENADSELIRKEIENQGGKTLYQHAVEHAAKHTTSLSEALTVKNLDG